VGTLHFAGAETMFDQDGRRHHAIRRASTFVPCSRRTDAAAVSAFSVPERKFPLLPL